MTENCTQNWGKLYRNDIHTCQAINETLVVFLIFKCKSDFHSRRIRASKYRGLHFNLLSHYFPPELMGILSLFRCSWGGGVGEFYKRYNWSPGVRHSSKRVGKFLQQYPRLVPDSLQNSQAILNTFLKLKLYWGHFPQNSRVLAFQKKFIHFGQ